MPAGETTCWRRWRCSVPPTCVSPRPLPASTAKKPATLADALADVGVLGWERPLVFVHPFERHSVYAEMPRARRARATPMLHRSWPARGADAIEIARHLMETDPSGDEWTAAVLIEAARREIIAGRIESAEQLVEPRRPRGTATHSASRGSSAPGPGRWPARAKVRRRTPRSCRPHRARSGSARRGRTRPARSATRSVLVCVDPRIVQTVRDQLVADHPQSPPFVSSSPRVCSCRLMRIVRVASPTSPSTLAELAEFSTSPTGRLLGIQRALRNAAQLQSPRPRDDRDTRVVADTRACWSVEGWCTSRSSAPRFGRWSASAHMKWPMR